MKFLIFFLLFSLRIYGEDNIDYQIYVNEFKKDLHNSKSENIIITENLRKLDIEFISIKNSNNKILNNIFELTDSVAMCNYDLTLVFINIDKYRVLSKNQKKKIIYHELGHCILGMEHEENNQSIMFQFANDYNSFLNKLTFFDKNKYFKIEKSLSIMENK